MRIFFGFVLGVALMSVVWVSGITPGEAFGSVKSAVTNLAKSAGETAEEIEYDDCVQKFLDKTSCYQKLAQKVCADKIHNACGADPRSK